MKFGINCPNTWCRISLCRARRVWKLLKKSVAYVFTGCSITHLSTISSILFGNVMGIQEIPPVYNGQSVHFDIVLHILFRSSILAIFKPLNLSTLSRYRCFIYCNYIISHLFLFVNTFSYYFYILI